MVVRGLSTTPRLEAVRQLVRGYGEEEWVARYLVSAVQVLYTLCPGLQCSVVLAADQLLLRCCLRGSEESEDTEDSLHRQHPGLALAQLDMDTLTAAPEHAELVAGIRGLHVAAGDILRVVAASAQLLSALVKKVNRILARRAALRRLDYLITQCTKVTICMANNEKRSFFTRYHIQTQ